MRCSGNYRKCVLCHCSLPKKCQQTPKDPKEFQKTPKGPQKTPKDPQRPPKDPKRPPKDPQRPQRTPKNAQIRRPLGRVCQTNTITTLPPTPSLGRRRLQLPRLVAFLFFWASRGSCFTRRGVCLFVCLFVCLSCGSIGSMGHQSASGGVLFESFGLVGP